MTRHPWVRPVRLSPTMEVVGAGGLGALVVRMAVTRASGAPITADAEALVVRLYRTDGLALLRLARLFVDDRDAAEDLVQEAFIRLARHAGRIDDLTRAPAYLRSIVLNLARDHNRRGLVSLRHHLAAGREVDVGPAADDDLVSDERHRAVLDAVRALPRRQRDCVALRYYDDLGVDEIAATLGVSPNSVKTHLKRGLSRLREELEP